MLRLDRNSENTDEGSPLVKMSANREVIGTWKARTSPMTTLMDEMEVDLNMLDALMLDGVSGEVDRVDVVVVDQSGLR
jgi:hypothetical protein